MHTRLLVASLLILAASLLIRDLPRPVAGVCSVPTYTSSGTVPLSAQGTRLLGWSMFGQLGVWAKEPVRDQCFCNLTKLSPWA